MQTESIKDPGLFDRYASSVIAGHPEHFDAIEINGVRGTGEDSIEVDNKNPEAYSVYLHFKTNEKENRVGVLCVGDFAMRADALRYAQELKDEYPAWEVFDHTSPELACDRMLDVFLLDAAKEDTLEEAIDALCEYSGITNKDVANEATKSFVAKWPDMAPSHRLGLLEAWRDKEREARTEYPEPIDENEVKAQQYFGLILSGLSALEWIITAERDEADGRLDDLVEDIKARLIQGGFTIDSLEDMVGLAKPIQQLRNDIESENIDILIMSDQ